MEQIKSLHQEAEKNSLIDTPWSELRFQLMANPTLALDYLKVLYQQDPDRLPEAFEQVEDAFQRQAKREQAFYEQTSRAYWHACGEVIAENIRFGLALQNIETLAVRDWPAGKNLPVKLILKRAGFLGGLLQASEQHLPSQPKAEAESRYQPLNELAGQRYSCPEKESLA